MKKQKIRALFAAATLAINSMAVWGAEQDKVDSLEQIKNQLEKAKRIYDQKLKQLEQRLEQAEQSNEETQEDLDQLAVEVSQQSNQKAANTYNPGIGMILNGRLLSASDNFEFSIPGFFPSEEIGPGDQGLQLGESELNMSANVDDKFYASTTIAFGEETEVEEAYIQTLNLGNGLNIKAGRFFSGIGYLADKHAHTDDFASRPLPYEAFLGGQFGDAGLQATWIAPTELYWESGIEIFRGESFPAAGASNSGRGVWTAFTHIGGDIGDSHSWRAGLSRLKADVEGRESDAGENFSGDSQLWVADFIYKWAPAGNRGQQEFKLLGEYFSRDEQGLFSDANLSDAYFDASTSGWYLEGVYRFARQWRVGLRTAKLSGDQLRSLFDDSLLDSQGHSPKQTSLMLDWSNSEFSRIRLQFDNNDLNGEQQNVWILQYIAAFGAHSAHSF